MALRSHRAPGRGGFTLIELLAVMAVMVVLLTIAVGASLHWGRGTAMRTSTQAVRSALVKARQWAVTHSEAIFFAYGNTNDFGSRGYYFVSTEVDGFIGKMEYLARGVVFTNLVGGLIEFRPDGRCAGSPTNVIDIVLVERDRGTNGLVSRIKVQRMTGYAYEENP